MLANSEGPGNLVMELFASKSLQNASCQVPSTRPLLKDCPRMCLKCF